MMKSLTQPVFSGTWWRRDQVAAVATKSDLYMSLISGI
jgi:hypothetical protein